MNILRKIGLILMIVIFIFSTIFTICIAGSSHGSLVISHSDEKLLAMVSAKRLELEPSYLLSSKKTGFQIAKETKENGKTTKYSYKFYIDKDLKLNAIVTETSQKDGAYIKNEYYYTDGILYTIIDGAKKDQQKIDSSTLIAPILTEINLLQDSLIDNIPISKNKAIIDFSFSPFYFLGIKYTLKDESKVVTYKYDLSGNLRKMTVKNTNGEKNSYVFSYDDEKLSFNKIYEF